VIVRHRIFKVELVEKLTLFALQTAHHGSTSPRFASAERNHGSSSISTDFCNKIRQKVRYAFKHYREDVLRRALRQSRFIIPSPTARRSILLIRSERSTSAALIAAIVSRNVLTLDPSDTIPPITTAIDPMAVT
jgi:hypothetical protein